MNIFRKFIRGFSVITGTLAALCAPVFAYWAYQYHAMGFENVSVPSAKMTVALLCTIFVARGVWRSFPPAPLPYSVARFCHVGEPL